MAIEPRPDMLPDKSLNNPPVDSEVPKTPEPVPPAPGGEPAKPAVPSAGGQTPETHLYAALQEERKLRKEEAERATRLEQELATLKSSPSTPSTPAIDDEDMSDEGKALKQQIGALGEQMARLEQERQLDRLATQYPVLAERRSEFETFAADYPRHKLENVAKIFLAEKGLLAADPARKGLERPTAGPRTPSSPKLTETEVKRLRENEPRKYTKMLREGLLNPDDIGQ